MQRLSIPGLPSLAIAEGATTPAPAYNGLAWSTTTSKVMRWNGTSWNSLVNNSLSTGVTMLTGTADASNLNLLSIQNAGTSANTQVNLQFQTFTNAGAATNVFTIRGFATDTVGNGYGAFYVGIGGTGTARASLTSTDLVLGGLPSTASGTAAVAMTIRGQDAVGTNVAGADLTLQPARSTGSGVPGKFVIKTAIAGASGASLNAAAERFRVEGDTVYITGNINLSGTAIGFPEGPGGTSFTTAPAVAAAGTDQASATALSATFNFITSGTGGVRLATPSNGAYCVVINHTAASVNIYPGTSGTIDSLSAAIALPPGNAMELSGNTSTDWIGIQQDIWDAENKVMTLPVNSGTLISPPDGHLNLFARNTANRTMPAFVGPSGLDSALQPLLARNKVGYYNPSGNSTTAPGIWGMGTPTIVSNGGTTRTARNVATTNILTRMKREAVISTSTAGTLGSWRVPAAQFTTGNGAGLGGFFTVIRFGVSDAATVAGARMFIGMSSSTGAATNVEPSTLTNCIGVAQLSTDSTQYYLVYGGSSAQTAIPLGTSLGAPTNTALAMELALFSPPSLNGVVHYQVTNIGTGVTVSDTITPGTVGVQTPASTTLLTHQLWRTNNATALTVGLDICSIYIETDN
jgi:hypothetical protein